MAGKKTASSKKPVKNETTAAKTVLGAAADAKLATNANKQRGQTLLDLIARRAARMTEDFYEVGKALKELLAKKLYVALGFPSFEAMLEEHGVIGITQARKLIEVVSRVPLKTALELGLEKAFALTRYADATPELDTPELLVAGGATIAGQSVAKLGRRAIEAETRKLRQKAAAKTGKVDPAQRDAEKVAKRGAAWLKARGAKKGAVEARRTKDGHVITITVPVAEAAKLFEG